MKSYNLPKTPKSAMLAYVKRFGALRPDVYRVLPNADSLARQALKVGKPDPTLEQFKAQPPTKADGFLDPEIDL